MKKIILCLVLLLCGCQAKEEVSNKNSSIVYQIFPYSYHDSDGNGVGDLKGIINKLDYIQSLGAGSIWLTPISESPTYPTPDYWLSCFCLHQRCTRYALICIQKQKEPGISPRLLTS